MKRIVAILTSVFCILLLPSFRHEEINTNEVKLYNTVKKENEIQTYDVDGKEHKIYWAQGIDAPLMSSDESLLGTEGYFEKYVHKDANGTNVTYQYPYESGKGYYDLNKDVDARINEKSLCYLGSAANMLLYWMEQNREYIDAYLNLLKEGKVYGQAEGLRKILPYDQSLWDMILQDPIITESDTFHLLGTELGKSKFITRLFTTYYNKTDDGFFHDRVIDYFINGYKDYEVVHDYDYGHENSEDNFVKDRNGGLFYPVFGKERLTKRHKRFKYSTFGQEIQNMLLDGKILGIGYQSPQGGHALTLYGAEYDENNQLVRFYVTDTDDSSMETKMKPDTVRGLHTMNVHEKDDTIFMTNVIDKIEFGAYIHDFYSLDLAQDKWVSKLNDLGAPKSQIIDSVKGNRTYPLNANAILSVESTYNDTGYLDYQWYKVNDGKGSPLKGENKKQLKVDTSYPGKQQYYLEIINNKNGKVNITKSDILEVNIDPNMELLNAQTPKVTFPSGVLTKPVNSSVRLQVKASVTDGGTLSYQWYQTNTNQIINPIKMNGETKPYIDIDTSKPGRINLFCEVTNTNYSDNITGDNVVKIRPNLSSSVVIKEITYENALNPTIVEQPKDLEVKVGDEAILTTRVNNNDGGEITYQWFKVDENYNETKLEGETNSSLKIDTSHNKEEMYRVRVYNYNKNALNNKYAETSSIIVNVKVTGEVLPSSENKLTSLKIEGVNLNPSFDPNINEYNANVHVNVDKLNLDYVLPSKATIQISNPNLVSGNNIITLKVIAENGDINTYTINVTKDDSHTFGEWVVIKEPTSLETGLKERVCSICGHKETEIIEKLEIENPIIPDSKPEIDDDLPVIKPNPGLPEPPVIENPSEDKKDNTLRNGLIIGGSVSLVVILSGLAIYFIFKHKKH